MIKSDVLDIRTARILVVDDQPDVCTVCKVALRREDHFVDIAYDPMTALEMLEADQYDVLLTDISMPGMSGLELGRRAQELHLMLDVVIMTGSPSYELLEDALQQGVADYLPKPFNIDQLRLTITRTLQRQRLRRENVRLQTLTHVIEATRAFTTSLNSGAVASALVDAIQRETGLRCVHVEHERGVLTRAAAEHLPCIYKPAGDEINWHTARLPLQAHGEQVGQVVMSAPDTQDGRLEQTEVIRLLIELGSLALYNAVMYGDLSDLDQQKSEFIALASHELRTPLSVILGYGGMLKGKLNERQNYYVNEINRASLRINDLVDDLINLRKMQREETQLRMERCDAHEILRSLQREITPLAEFHHVQLSFHVATAPLTITADRERLTLALAHLITNGIRFTPQGGRVVVSAGVQDAAHGGNLLFVVDDTGIGIPPYEVHRIFKRFYQIADSRTREQGGLGIGLALARGIIEIHGGTVSVYSQPGHGSRFVTSLPASLLVT